MSLTRTTLLILIALAIWTGAKTSRAEHPSMPASAPTVQLERFTPFTEPDHFGPDLQFFAPADVSSYGGGDPPNIGFYFSLERYYVAVQRPEMRPILRAGFPGNFRDDLNAELQQLGDQGLLGFTGNRDTGYDTDFTWGNRYEFGYMTADEHGWNMVHWHIDGPAEYLSQVHERINRINEDDDPPDDPDPIFQDRNPRQYKLLASINVATFSSIELNKVWRRKEFHNGGVLEPFLGARFMTFKDRYRQDGYGRFELDPDDFPDLSFPTPDGPVEVLVRDQAVFENNLLGGHLGFRYFYEKEHWTLSSELRIFACHNFQYLTRFQKQIITNYGTAGDDVVYELRNRARAYDRRDEFTWGGDLRAEAAYAVTRDIQLRFGLACIDLANGIGRGNDIRDNRQDVFMAGVTFGVTINR
jgi:hypothetical protein